MLFLAVAASIASIVTAYSDPVGPTLPWGIHTTYGVDHYTELTIMWSTRSVVTPSVVLYSVNGGATQSTTGEEIPYSNADNVQTLHRVYLSGLTPGASVTYSVGDGGVNVQNGTYTVVMPDTNWNPPIAIFGDMGISSNAQATMPFLLADAASGDLDVVVLVGDVAYNLDSNSGATGDAFMVQIEPLVAQKPLFICPGTCGAMHFVCFTLLR